MVPASVTETGWPAMVRKPFSVPPVVFERAVTSTVPLPVPLEVPTERKEASEVAVHAQFAELAVTSTVVLPPPLSKLRVDGETVKVQFMGPV